MTSLMDVGSEAWRGDRVLRLGIAGVVGLVAVVGSVVVARHLLSGAAAPTPESRPVRVATVSPDDGVRELRAAGITRSVRRAELSFTLGGRLMERTVDIGDHVSEGQALAVLDERPFVNAVRAARAQESEARAHLGQARRDRRRTRILSADEVVSRSHLEHARSAVRALRAGRSAARSHRSEARRMLSEATLRAPFDAIVSEVLLEAGEFAVAGRPVIVLSGTEGVEVEVEVPESHIHRIAQGADVLIDFPLAGLTAVRGTVQLVGQSAGQVGRQFPVIVRLAPDVNVVPGMSAEVLFEMPGEPGVSVPVAAVLDPGGGQAAVFVVRQGKGQRVPVEVRDLVGDRVVVDGPLAEGDQVVVGGHAGLVHDEPVRVVPNAPAAVTQDQG